MWDMYQLPTHGNFSLRKIAHAFLAVLFSALLLTIINSTVTYAADATWDDSGSIVYDGKTYRPESPVPAGVVVPDGAAVYVHREEGTQGTARVLYIERDADTKKEMQVKVAEYTLTQSGELTNPRPPTDISLEAKPEPKNKTQCDVAGIGWIICTTSRFIAEGMDKIFDIIASYLVVKPISTDTSSGLYKAWSIALGIANLMFILAFLIIIYSQITSVGLNNYNIKKMIPKLVIAAILVNISYYVCAIAVDVSNVLGHSIQQALIDIRKTLPDPVSGVNWNNLTTYVLSGGTIVAGGVGAVVGLSAAGGVSGLAFLLFPILVAGALAVLVALLILAARQALIVVLIVVAPLAFVAYLLPNTEKWFEKWRDLFMTMLLVFPLFSLLFGGSQLASYIVIENTDQISVVIFAMFIQVAPLVMTPFLVKFSGSLLGRLAGMVNNPQKGLVDRTRNWANDRAGIRKAAMISKGANKQFGTSRMAYRRDMSRRNREGLKKMYEGEADAAWHNDDRYHAQHRRNKTSEVIKNMGESTGDVAFERYKTGNPTLQKYVGRQRLNQDSIANLQAKEEAAWQEAKSADFNANGTNQFAHFAPQAQQESIQAQATAYRKGTAEAMQRIEYSNVVVSNTPAGNAWAREAGGIDVVNDAGADSARASAMAALKKSKNDNIAEGRALYEHFNLSSGDRQKLAKGITVTGTDDAGNTRTFDANTKYVRMAAIEQQVTYGTVEERQELILKTGKDKDLYEFRDIVSEAMVKGNIGQVANYLGGKTIDDVRSGRLMGTQDLLRSAATSIAKGKLSPEQLLNQDKTSMETIVEAVRQVSTGQIHLDGPFAASLGDELERLFGSAERAMSDPRINVRLGERANAIEELRDIGRAGTPYTPPTPPPGGAGTP